MGKVISTSVESWPKHLLLGIDWREEDRVVIHLILMQLNFIYRRPAQSTQAGDIDNG